jgi:hypothetical protein
MQASADAAAAAAAKAAEFEGVSIEGLRGDVESTLSEASLGQERTTLLQLEVAELTRARDQLAGGRVGQTLGQMLTLTC